MTRTIVSSAEARLLFYLGMYAGVLLGLFCGVLLGGLI